MSGSGAREATKATLSRRQLAAVALGALCPAACERRVEGRGMAPATSSAPDATAGHMVRGVTGDTIKVGSYGPLSGPAAAWGVMLHGMAAYFEHLNRHGGIHGRRLELLTRDDQYNPARTPALVRELVERQEVFAIVGGIGTANGRAVAGYLQGRGVPFFTPASGDPYWSESGLDNVYTVYPSYLTEGRILGDYVARELGARRVAVLRQDDDFGEQGLAGVTSGLSQHAGAAVSLVTTCQPTDTDLGGPVSRIAEASPDVLVIYAGPKQAALAVRELHARRKKPQVVTSFVLSDPVLFEMAGPAYDGTISSQRMELSSSDHPGVAHYREILREHAPSLPVGNFTMAGFAFAMPFAEALQRAGRALSPTALYRALESLVDYRGGGPHWQGGGLTAPITFGPARRLGTDAIYLTRGVGGRWERISDWLRLGPAESTP